jgi:hypothetical protein
MPAKHDDSEVLDTDDIDMNDIVASKPAPAPYRNPGAAVVMDVEAGANGSSSDDPFAKREGKTLTWKNINMTLVRCCPFSMCQSLLKLPPYLLRLISL